MEYSSIPEMFWMNVEKYQENPCLGYKKNESWSTLTYEDVGRKVRALLLGLAALDVKANDKVSVLANNRPEWAFADFAILSLGAINVPVYPTLQPHQIKYILKNGDVKIIVTEDQTQTQKVLEIFDRLDDLAWIIVMDDSVNYEEDYVLSWEQVAARGKELSEEKQNEALAQWKNISSDDLLTIIYTSGTTGEPKGVMLTHGNLLSNVEGGLERLDVGPGDRFLSFLPLSHSFERMAGHFLPFSVGCTVYYAESIETVPENMQEVSPTVMTSVPRLYEKMYMRVTETVEQGSGLRKSIFRWAFQVGGKYQEERKSGNISAWTGLRYRLAYKLVFSKLHQRIGGAVRFFVSGGAPLSADIARFFERAGILILEGYGLTETSPVIAVNPLETYRIGTVGPPIFNVEVKIDEDGEILTRGPHVMKGYYKNPEATQEIMDEVGWLHTGDIGILDEDNFLSVTDRKKNLIVTSGGKNVAPQPIEGALSNSPFIEQVLLIGDKRNFISALIVPNFENLKEWANKQSIYYGSPEELIELQEVNDLIQSEIGQRMENFARFEQVKKFRLLPKEFTIQNGNLTPTLKIKRQKVENGYRELIESMYT